MAMSDPSIFRKEILERYQQKREQRVLPQVMGTSIFLTGWLLLATLLLTELLVWGTSVPIFIDSQGVTLSEQVYQQLRARGEPISEHTLLFVPATYAGNIHNGNSVHIQVSKNRTTLDGIVEEIEPTVLSPSDAQQRYMLAAKSLTQPVVVIGIKTDNKAAIEHSGPINGHIQVGMSDVFSLLLEQHQR